MIRRNSLLFVGCLIAGCQTDATEAQEGCFTTADCAPGSVCNAFEGSCEPEPEQGFVGSFRCVVGELAPPSTLEWYSEVVGNLGGERYVLAGPPPPACTNSALVAGLNGGNPELTTSFYGVDDDFELQVAWGPVSRVAEAVGRVEFEPAIGIQQPLPSASFIHWAMVPNPDPDAILSQKLDLFGSQLLGHSTGGYGYLGNPVESGEVLAGFVKIDMAPTENVLFVPGAECADGGTTSCGRSYAARCEMGMSGTQFCTTACSNDEDCVRGLACRDGLCLIACEDDGDCPEHLACDLSAEIGGCW